MVVSSTVWWASMSRSPVLLTSRSIRECRASAVSMWSKNPTPVEMLDSPVPSRSRLSRTLDSDVARSRAAVRAGRSAMVSLRKGCGSDAGEREHPGQGIAEGRHLGRGTGGDPEPAGRTGLADQDAPVEQLLPDPVPVGEPAEEDEVGVGLGHLQPLTTQPRRDLVA